MPVTSLWIVLAALFIVPVTDAKAEFPNKELLEELQTRLLEPPDCLPLCADINYLQVDISPTVLSLDFIVDSYQDVAIPLPGHAKQWLPQKIYIDNKPAQGLYRNDDEQLWMFVPAGHHKINTKGILPQRYTLQIALPLKPHHINVKSKGWKVEGLHDDGEVDNQLQFTRLQQTQDDVQSPAMESINFPSFARVERTLLLGLTWRVRTTLTRLSPTGSAIVLNIPLLPGESVTTDGIRVSDNKVLVNMDAKAKEFHWESVLDQRDTIVLQAPETTHWIETWKADVSPIWHMSSEGIAVIHHQTANRWLPEWRPWPGEKVILHLNRPQGILGQTVTIDFSELEIKPGQRITDSRLNLRLRSSQGGQQQITLPANAELQSVVIDGQSRPIRQEGRRVLLPIVPGTQNIKLKWRVPNGIIPFFKTPDVDLGAASVNTSMEIQLPFNRWALMAGGPQLGPAVLYWGVLIAVVLISFALGRIKFTPLKSYHWLLLGIGLSPVSIEGAVLVIAWLLALGWRKNLNPDIDKKIFNLVQIGLIILTFLALITLVYAISRGLLGYPDMQIIGNGSNNHLLRWYQDRSSSVLPHAWVISIPMIFYRLAMLAWALWLAFALLRWLRWGWENFSTHGYWRSIQFRKGKQASLPAAKSSTAGERGGKG